MGNENGNGEHLTPEKQEVVKQDNQIVTANQQIANTNNLEFGEEIRKMLPTAGSLELTDRQNEILFAPVQDNEISIKPDGLIYLSWTKYAGRLTKTFSTQWTMLPQGMPRVNNNLIIWGFHLIIKGVYCGFAIGEQQFFDNGRMTYGEACEGAKSNALMRLCKSLGVGLELWDKEFINKWLDTHADKKWDEGKRKFEWSLKPNTFAKHIPVTPAVAPIVSQGQSQTSAPVVKPVELPKTTPEAKIPVSTPVSPTSTKPVKVTIKEIPKATATAKEIPATKGFTGKGKNSKLPENNGFLAAANEASKEVPVEKIAESEVAGLPANVIAFHKNLDDAKGTGALKMAYDHIKISFGKGEISEEHKEDLRMKANALFVKLSSQGK